jgi:hypothetical protein
MNQEEIKKIEEREKKYLSLAKEIEKGIMVVVGRAIFLIKFKTGKPDPYTPYFMQIEVTCSNKKLTEATPEQIDNLIEFCKKWKEIIEVFKPKEEEE